MWVDEEARAVEPEVELAEGEIRAISDRLLEHLAAVEELELRKRRVEIGTAEFVDLAAEVAAYSVRVSAWAQIQLRTARRAAAARGRGVLAPDVIDTIEPRPTDLIIAAWRDAVLSFEQAEAGSPARREALATIDRLRREYEELGPQTR
jgi:hypothetical protein